MNIANKGNGTVKNGRNLSKAVDVQARSVHVTSLRKITSDEMELMK
ncbi:hypothetical protein [Alicyclobacillus ferrooxydans]|nr:hypothetical protein [Alicyclobacillus ferrooxydans]